ncbi:MAG: membrane dipeptidase [Alphaproteobacteria bacterium]|nr:membrane dipeptidase [Alphaproteobacteria bacterium]MBV9692898.1 membrane dipeptidase [Alphaproteobacteria bacterium]
MNRREVLLSASALVAVPGLALCADGDDISAAARALYEKALVFDANLSPPVADALPFPPAMIAMVRASGVSAVKTSLGGTDESFEDTLGEIALLQRMIEFYPDVFLQVREAKDFERAKREDKFGILFSFEASSAFEGKIERIELFRDLGVRVMQLSYNKTSPWASGVMADPPTGLSEEGRKAVAAMNAQGVAIDISHANLASSNDVLAASKTAPIVTHCGCEAIHSHPRNKPDSLLRAVAQRGGAVGIYDLPYLSASPRQPTLDDYMAHLTHALAVCGEDHVGIGSDSGLAPFDLSAAGMAAFRKNAEYRQKTGVAAPEEDRPPYVIGLNTPRRSEVIADALLKRGYPARVAEKVLGRNFVDALGRIWS